MITKIEAKYREQPNGDQRCSRCSMYRSPGRCTLVKGAIASSGYCVHFERKK